MDSKKLLDKYQDGERNFCGANLRGTNLRGTNLRGANLRGANLRGANLRGANLREVNLINADLRNADLFGVSLREANLFGVDLGDADLGGADLRDADLRGADLRGADLRDADLTNADLRGGNLFGVDLRGANLFGVDLRGANLRGVNLRKVDLREANLEPTWIDFREVLIPNLSEINHLYQALVNGKIDGSAYKGDCACLSGTLAHGVADALLPASILRTRDSFRPIERFFLRIKPGDTPDNSWNCQQVLLQMKIILQEEKSNLSSEFWNELHPNLKS